MTPPTTPDSAACEATGAPNFVAMSAPQLLDTCKDTALMWARAFIQIVDSIGRDKIDESYMIGWFAAAIEGSSDVRRWRAEAVKRANDELRLGACGEAD